MAVIHHNNNLEVPLGLLLGFGAAYCSHNHRDDAWGDSARAMGHVALTAHAQAKAVNDKHHVVQKSQQVAQRAWQRAQAFDRQHDVVRRVRDWLRTSWEATREFVKRHQLVERGIETVDKVISWAIERQKNLLEHSSSPSSPPHRVVVEEPPLRSRT